MPGSCAINLTGTRIAQIWIRLAKPSPVCASQPISSDSVHVHFICHAYSSRTVARWERLNAAQEKLVMMKWIRIIAPLAALTMVLAAGFAALGNRQASARQASTLVVAP